MESLQEVHLYVIYNEDRVNNKSSNDMVSELEREYKEENTNLWNNEHRQIKYKFQLEKGSNVAYLNFFSYSYRMMTKHV